MDKKISTGIGIAIILIVAALVILMTIMITQTPVQNAGPVSVKKATTNNQQGGSQITKDQSCLDSGGKVETDTCCQSADDFPNSCTIGACGCAPANSHQVKTCNCGEEKCFDGNTCVSSGSPSVGKKSNISIGACNKLKDEINNMLDLAKSCSQDSDCTYAKKYEACPFPCYPIFNKSKDLADIDKKVDEWKNNCHTWCDYECGSAPDQSRIKCRNKKCVEV